MNCNQPTAGTGSLKRCGRLNRSQSLPMSEADPTARMLASLSHATSLTQSPDASSGEDEEAVPGPSGTSFSSQRSGSPFTVKRDKSFADVQRFLGDSLVKSASKGMSFAKQLQVSLAWNVLAGWGWGFLEPRSGEVGVGLVAAQGASGGSVGRGCAGGAADYERAAAGQPRLDQSRQGWAGGRGGGWPRWGGGKRWEGQGGN